MSKLRFEQAPVGARALIDVRTLGRFDIHIRGTPLRFARRAPQRTLQLLGVLTAHGGRSVSVGTIADLLWPDAEGFDAERAFTTTLHRLRRLLGIAESVHLVAGQVWLAPEICGVDAWQLERALRSAANPDELVEALELYEGPFLGDDPSPWALAARARLDRLVAGARQLLVRSTSQSSSWRLALGTVRAAAE
jgi:DNA-binding SARP family transcriptional activator